MRLSKCPCGSGRAVDSCCQDTPASQDARVSTRVIPNSTHDALDAAVRLHQQGEVQDAIVLYQQVLEVEPDNADALNLLGVAVTKAGQYDLAVACIGRAIELNGTAPSYYQNLSAVLREMGDLPACVGCLREATRLWPGNALLRGLLGDALRQWDDIPAAETCDRVADLLGLVGDLVRREPGDWRGALGACAEAIQRYEAALGLGARDPALHAYLGGAFNHLGNVLGQSGRLLDARAAFEHAVRFAPGLPEARMSLAWLQQNMCAWDGLEDHWSEIRAAVRNRQDGGLTNPCFFIYLPSTAAEQLIGARSWAATHYAAFEAPARALQGGWSKPGPRERLHIGYVSSDYRTHAVAHLVAELFERHDRASIMVSAYSIGSDDGSAVRARIVRGVDRFVDLTGMSYAAAAERIQADGIDILVDFDSYSHPADSQVQALRPAPIQVNFIGFPGTSGAPFIDYVIVDRFVVPPEQAGQFSERLAYMPDCTAPNESHRSFAARTPTRAECGLPEDGFIFCSFNQLYKITPTMFALWMRLLAATPGSMLWLLNRNSLAEINLRQEAARAGIDPRRVVLDPYLPRAEYLVRHRLADLGLDTSPGNGGSSTNDALWAGLPVLTCAGETFTSRLAGTQLHAVGLPELVTYSLDEYEALALALARDPGRLSSLRARLAVSHDVAPLFDCARYTRNLEALYWRMWEEYRRDPNRADADRTPLSV
ncbi:MAG TPA: tetratricopeptide repeat protein [Chloroflexota bacterium]|nr:tetratricopeptide repeat protein [Chloroflexota bacterium]